MCYRLEFRKMHDGYKSTNKLPCNRLLLNVIGLFIILAAGALAAVFATYHEEWFPTFKGDDAIYRRITKNRDFSGKNRVTNLTGPAIDLYCENEGRLKLGTLIFRCGVADSGRCIPVEYLCDDIDHCGDGSDETTGLCEKFCELAVRRDLRFKCQVAGKNGTSCMSSRMRCDGIEQCTGETERERGDEYECEGTVFSTGHVCSETNNWVCADHQQCVRQEFRCNGISDCRDGSDEAKCSFR